MLFVVITLGVMFACALVFTGILLAETGASEIGSVITLAVITILLGLCGSFCLVELLEADEAKKNPFSTFQHADGWNCIKCEQYIPTPDAFPDGPPQTIQK